MGVIHLPPEDLVYLGPLKSGQRVVIVGGGPSGASCAIALRRLAEARGIDLEVVLFEAKDFRAESNVCVGVLSPPFGRLLGQLGLQIPRELIQRVVTGYVLHADQSSLVLDDEPGAEPTLVVHRADLDQFLLDSAERLGVQVMYDVVVDLRYSRSTALVVSSGGARILAQAVVGAVGLNRFAMAIFESGMEGYRRPKVMRSILIEVPMAEPLIEERFGNRVHAILPPSLPRIEFGALTPKRDRVVVNAAGEEIDDDDFDGFLRLPLVQRMLAGTDLAQPRACELFPTRPASHFAQDRIVTIGNASGLMRPLKGKGINTGIQMGMRAAATMMDVGVSDRAFEALYRSCRDITSEYKYGLFLRWLYRTSRRMGWMDAVIEVAGREKRLRHLFQGMVSGEDSYKQLVRSTAVRPLLLARTGVGILRYRRQDPAPMGIPVD
ncbi:MAG: NAD(P)/FAD-dependent oxidoreductase [Chloroflexi bacterium]|nr:NAD(P)/FAD-dependent oxidoreductase [Chloroflexota bacterium]